MFRVLAGLVLLGWPVMASAQDSGSRAEIDQLRPAAPSAAASQVPPAGRASQAPLDISSDAPLAAAPAAGATVRSLAQVTGERGRSDAGAQLTRGRPSAEAPISGTDRREGRNTRMEVLEGQDRCDPQKPGLPGERCRDVIETRAAEFRAPEVQPLSPEQRLLVAQRELAPASRDAGTAARRLANGEIDDSNAALAVASLALGGRPPPDDGRKEEPMEPSAVDAIVAAIVSGMGANPPH